MDGDGVVTGRLPPVVVKADDVRLDSERASTMRVIVLGILIARVAVVLVVVYVQCPIKVG